MAKEQQPQLPDTLAEAKTTMSYTELYRLAQRLQNENRALKGASAAPNAKQQVSEETSFAPLLKAVLLLQPIPDAVLAREGVKNLKAYQTEFNVELWKNTRIMGPGGLLQQNEAYVDFYAAMRKPPRALAKKHEALIAYSTDSEQKTLRFLTKAYTYIMAQQSWLPEGFSATVPTTGEQLLAQVKADIARIPAAEFAQYAAGGKSSAMPIARDRGQEHDPPTRLDSDELGNRGMILNMAQALKPK